MTTTKTVALPSVLRGMSDGLYRGTVAAPYVSCHRAEFRRKKRQLRLQVDQSRRGPKYVLIPADLLLLLAIPCSARARRHRFRHRWYCCLIHDSQSPLPTTDLILEIITRPPSSPAPIGVSPERFKLAELVQPGIKVQLRQGSPAVS
jgi:hypothetical protein